MGFGGVLEKDINLSVALLLQQFLEQSGMQVILTRSDDNGIYENSDSVRDKKNSDMKNREKLMKESGADAFISIHMNKFPDGKYSGPQVFYSGNHEQSKVLAERIQKSMTEELNPAMKRDIKKADSGIYLLKKAKIPAVLVECGFLSNMQEQQKLMDEAYRKRIAWAIYCGVLQYLEDI